MKKLVIGVAVVLALSIGAGVIFQNQQPEKFAEIVSSVTAGFTKAKVAAEPTVTELTEKAAAAVVSASAVIAEKATAIDVIIKKELVVEAPVTVTEVEAPVVSDVVELK